MRIGSLTKLICVLLVVQIVSKPDNFIQFQKANCIVHDRNTIKNVTCTAKSINRTCTIINMQAYIARRLDVVLINIQMHKKTEINYRPFLINVTENYCDFFSKNRAGAYFRFFAAMYMSYSNLNHKCPYMGHVYIKDFPMVANKFLSILPPGAYRLDVVPMSNGRIITLQFFLEIIERSQHFIV